MKKIYFYILIALVIMPVAVSAQYTLLEPLPCIEGTGNGNCSDGKTIKEISLDTYIGYIFKFSIALAAFLAVIMIIYAGFEYMLTESVISKGDAKGKIKNALTGLLMVLASYLILRTIDPRLVEINTKLDPITIKIEKGIDFLGGLRDDLKNLTDIKQQEMKALLADKKTKEDRLLEIRQMIENNGESNVLTPKEVTDLLLEEQLLKSQIKAIDSNVSSTLAQGTGLIQFNKALGLLGADGNYTEAYNAYQASTNRSFLIMKGGLSETTKIDVQNAKLIIDAKYKEYINGAKSDPETVQALTKQRDFFLKQVDEQADLMKSVMSYKRADVGLDGNMAAYRAVVKPYLEKTLSDYQKEYTNPSIAVPTGLEDQYKQLTGSRIEVIKEALNPK